jgi:phospholipid-binding lipoprotein MlaA
MAGGWLRALQALLAALALLLAGGCATVPAGGNAAPAPIDPWENWNRKVFAFNDTLDTKVLKPVAETYRKVVPSFVRTGISNVLGNLYDIWSAANHLLQGKVQMSLEMGMRVVTNSIVGLGGLLDPASEMGLTRRQEDFGQTLGRWGVANGPYMVLPFFGPSTVRDGFGLLADRMASPSSLPETERGRFAVNGIELINTRTNLLDAGNLVDQVALDKYSFFRDAYLARRRDAVYDGAPPLETFDDAADPMADEPAAKPAAAAASAPASAASAASAASK